MQTDLESIHKCFRTAYEAYFESRDEAKLVNDFYHNRQLSDEDAVLMDSRGQPKETYNLLKAFGRHLLGYFDTVSTSFLIEGRQQDDQMLASVMKGVLEYTLDKNNFTEVAFNLKKDLLLTGLCCAYIDVKQLKDDDTSEGLTDQWGRPQMDTVLKHVPIDEIIVDHMAREQDFSDARFVHRFKWVPKDYIRDMWPDKLDDLQSNTNATGVNAADFGEKWSEYTDGWLQEDNYLIIHTIITDDNKKTWSIFWSGDVELERKEVTHKNVKFPYIVYKLFKSNKVEYYGVFREIVETQKAINHAVAKLAVLTSIKKVAIKRGAVKDINKFRQQWGSALSIVEMEELEGMREIELGRKISEHYDLIEKGEQRILKVLAMNFSFLGQAFASDSGKKVQLQQNATVVALRYLTSPFEQMYRNIGWAVINTVKQYYHATQIISIVDEELGTQYMEINQPLTYQAIVDGQVVEKFFFEEVLDPANGKPMQENGKLVMAPVARVDTDVRLTRVDLKVDTTHAGLEEERNALLTERTINGPAGQLLAQTFPGLYLIAQGEGANAVQTKEGRRIGKLFINAGRVLAQQQGQEPVINAAAGSDTPVGQQPRASIPGGV